MKKNKKIVEAWRSEEYYLSLSDEERAGLPEHPSGPTAIADEVLHSVTGGCGDLHTGTNVTPCVTVCGQVYCY